MKGGARAGSGRKRGRTKEQITITLPFATVAALKEIERRKRSKFVNEAILKAIEEK